MRAQVILPGSKRGYYTDAQTTGVNQQWPQPYIGHPLILKHSLMMTGTATKSSVENSSCRNNLTSITNTCAGSYTSSLKTGTLTVISVKPSSRRD